ncbi:MAG: putative Ig domain-containing protein [Bacteroidales bacterium]
MLLLFYSNALLAQKSEGGTPPSFKYSSKELDGTIDAVKVTIPFTVEELKARDRYDQEKFGTPPCFAKNIDIDYNMTNSGSWTTLPDGQKIWRLRIKADGAMAIILSYNNFLIPEGASLFVYNAEHTQVIGSFTSETNPLGGSFSTEMVAGDDVILEYVAPKAMTTESYTNVSIDGVGYVYDYINVSYLVPGENDQSKYGESGTCMVNINCSEGNDWQTEKKGVCRMLMYISNGEGGTGWYLCTGTLVNNTAQDLKPYLLSANHCYVGATDNDLLKWQFTFHYESPTCENADPVQPYTLVGSYFRAQSPIDGGSDGLLLELASEIPLEWDVYYNGWDISGDVTEGGGVGIHHPAGDIKKISTYESYSTSTWPGEDVGATDAHWLLTFISTENGHGVTEGGSSGSPLFNANHLVIGTLTGGNSSCTYTSGSNYYGKLWYHWDQYGNSSETQMKTWLDPLNLGVKTLQGINYNPSSPRIAAEKREIVFTGVTELNVPSQSKTIVVSGSNLTSEITVSTKAPFEVSSDGSTWSKTTSLPVAGGDLFVRYTPTFIGTQIDTIKLTNSEVNYTLYILASGSSCPDIVFSSDNLPNAQIETFYETSITASGNTAPFTYSLTGGALPDGLEMNESGKVSGTPTRAGLYTFTITATDQYGCTGIKDYNLNVECGTISKFPYKKDFEDGLIPSCWSEDYVSGNISWSYRTGCITNGVPGTAHGGSVNACLSSDNYNKNVTKLITPQFDIANLPNPTLAFWHAQAAWLEDQDELRVYYKSSAQGEWKLLAEYTQDIPDWTMEIMSLPEPSSEYSIAFEGTSNYGYGVVLDDVSIFSPSITVNPEVVSFSDGVIGTASDPKIVTVIGSDLIDSVLVKTNLPFNVSNDGVAWDTVCMLDSTGGNLYVRFSPQASSARYDSIMLTSTGIVKKIDIGGTMTGISDALNSGIAAYPNPFTDELIVRWEGSCEGISVVDVTGKVVYSSAISRDLTQISIPTSEWSVGVYFVKLTQNGTAILKVIKH